MKIDKPTLLTTLAAGLEYYDFILYALLAPTLAKTFFPADDPIFDEIKVYGLFAAGYLVRPLGGILFGLIGDRFGRRLALVASISLMAVSTGSIALLPTYASVGMAASIALIVLRLGQGLSFGAELPGSITLLADIAEGRALGTRIGILFGTLCAISGLSFALQWALLGSAKLESPLAMRLAFGAGAGVAVVAYLIRRDIQETHVDRTARSTGEFMAELLKTEARSLLKGFAITFASASTILGYLWLPHYYSTSLGLPLETAYGVLACGYALSTTLLPILGGWLPVIGANRLFILGLTLLAFLLPLAPSHQGVGLIPPLLFALAFQVVVTLLSASYPYLLAIGFAPRYRFTAIALSYNAGFAAASFTPTALSYLVDVGVGGIFVTWLAPLCILFVLAALVPISRVYKKERILSII